MKQLYDELSSWVSRKTTHKYSTSFTLASRMLHRSLHDDIYALYGWVRLGDEIVDTFLDHDRASMLAEYREETYRAVARKISTNPVIHSFQRIVHAHQIPQELYDTFLDSMAMDLEQNEHGRESFEKYILGSAQVVGLMCLKIFVQGDEALYQKLKPAGMSLGSAFQKVNFLRDLRQDYKDLGRIYFPGVNFEKFSLEDKRRIEKEIEQDFSDALVGIKMLPRTSRLGVYSAFMYYRALFARIQKTPPEMVLKTRIRVPNWKKIWLTMFSYGKYSLRLL